MLGACVLNPREGRALWTVVNGALRFSHVLGHLVAPWPVRGLPVPLNNLPGAGRGGSGGGRSRPLSHPPPSRGRKRGQAAEATHPGPGPRGGCPPRSRQVPSPGSEADGTVGWDAGEGPGGGAWLQGAGTGLQTSREHCAPTHPAAGRVGPATCRAHGDSAGSQERSGPKGQKGC